MRNLYRRSVLAVLICSSLYISPAMAQSSPDEVRQGVETALLDSVKFWNAGDLSGFMRGYWDSSEMTFTSGGKLIRGHDALEKRYATTYGSNTKAMGQLSFDHIEIMALGDDHSLAVGQWHLSYPAKAKGGKLTHTGGIFSLVLKKTPDGWKIVHDHTSKGQP